MKMSFLLRAFLLMGIVLVLAVVLYPMFGGPSGHSHRSLCFTKVKQQALAMQLYLADFDRYPGSDWIGGIRPYIGNEGVFKCQIDQEKVGYGFAFNSNLVGKPEPNEPLAAIVFETPDMNPNVVTDRIVPIPESRHRGIVAVGFVDGHAKMVQPEDLDEISTAVTFPKPRPEAIALPR